MSHDSLVPMHDSLPWYKQFWPWFIIALPLSSVVAGMTTLYIALTNADDVVIDNWYKEGRAINRSLVAEQQADRLGIHARAVLSDTALRVSITSDAGIPWPETLELSLRHPTQAEKDITGTLRHGDDGNYDFEGLVTGMLISTDWHMNVRAASWQFRDRVRIAATPLALKAMN